MAAFADCDGVALLDHSRHLVRALVHSGQRRRCESRGDPDNAGQDENKYGLTAKFAKGKHTVSLHSSRDCVWSEDKHCLTAEFAEFAEKKRKEGIEHFAEMVVEGFERAPGRAVCLSDRHTYR
jgi:hypothetical protein